MKTLLHICCGPCATACVKYLLEQGHEVKGCFYNPNVHPYTEHEKRLEAARRCAEAQRFELVGEPKYLLQEFLRAVAFREADRCTICYRMRLEYVAHIAKRGRFDAFTSTLLISPHQKHDLARSIGESVAKEVGVGFFYHDFRDLWRESRALSNEFDLYHQQYCGCIYSEFERYGGARRKRS